MKLQPVKVNIYTDPSLRAQGLPALPLIYKTRRLVIVKWPVLRNISIFVKSPILNTLRKE
jgi:hypothetical protein